MIAKWLDQDFRQLFDRNPQVRVVLWFDDRGDFARLLDEGKFPSDDAPYTLLRYDADAGHGQLWMKAQIVWETRDLLEDERDKMRWVLYLPFEREATEIHTGQPGSLEYLLEYRYRGREWLVGGKKPTLFGFLRDHGVPLPDNVAEQRKLWEGGRESLLAKYASKFWDRDERFWREQLTAEKVQGRIIGEIENHLFEVLADPEHAVDYLAEQDLLGEFKREMATQFGTGDSIEDDPRQWVEDFTIRLALTECYVGFGEPDDFPFMARVADRMHRDRCLGFLQTWLNHSDFSRVYRDLIRGLESAYSLRNWAEGREGRCGSLLHLAEMEWLAFYRELSGVVGSRAESTGFFDKNESRIGQEADGYWARDARILSGWAVARDTLALIQGATQAVQEAEGLSAASGFVQAYAERWHRTDRAYWQVFSAVKGGDFDHLQTVADLHYQHYLEAANMAFQQSLRLTEGLPPPSSMEMSETLWDTSGRHAVIMVDALRYDLAAALMEKVHDEAELQPWVGPLPPITSVGMTALLAPETSELAADILEGKLQLLHDRFGDLGIKSNRKALLKDRYKAEAIELDDLLRAGGGQEEEHECLVVFTKDIDAAGHATSDLPSLFGPLIENLSSAINKLQRLGYNTIHVVTDHGFLLVPHGEDCGELPSHVCRGRRHVVLADGAATDLLALPMSMAEGLRLAFASGVCSFGSPQNYMHGGASLQELVVPHLTVRTEQAIQRVAVSASITTTEVTTLTVRVTLSAASAPASLFDAAQPRQIDLFVTRDDERVSEPREIVVGSEATQEVSATIFLDEQAGLRKGDLLRLRGRDVETGEELIEGITLTVVRDF